MHAGDNAMMRLIAEEMLAEQDEDQDGKLNFEEFCNLKCMK